MPAPTVQRSRQPKREGETKEERWEHLHLHLHLHLHQHQIIVVQTFFQAW